MKKKALFVVAIGMFTIAISGTSLAGVWKQEIKGWWYQNDDGTYPVNTWDWIDGNRDGVAERYCFDENGYMYTSVTTSDGYQVNDDGAWVVDGVVQTKVIQSDKSNALGSGMAVDTGRSSGTAVVEGKSQYVTKRICERGSNDVEGGRILKYNDFTGKDTFSRQVYNDYLQSINYEMDGELFCPSNIDFPYCVLIEVVVEENTIVKATPIWIDSGEWDYGGFSGYGVKGDYIRGRMEWGAYEKNDPEYAEQLKQELTEEAKQRAFEMYPDMIVDYVDNKIC